MRPSPLHRFSSCQRHNYDIVRGCSEPEVLTAASRIALPPSLSFRIDKDGLLCLLATPTTCAGLFNSPKTALTKQCVCGNDTITRTSLFVTCPMHPLAELSLPFSSFHRFRSIPEPTDHHTHFRLSCWSLQAMNQTVGSASASPVDNTSTLAVRRWNYATQLAPYRTLPQVGPDQRVCLSPGSR